MQGAQRNLIFENTVRDNDTGISISDSPTSQYNIPSFQNQIFNNNFISNNTHAYNFNNAINTDNRFFRNLPEGGNYWSGHTSPDAGLNGVVDVPYAFLGGQDSIPWTTASGWEDWTGDPGPTAEYLYIYLGNNGWSEPVGTWNAATKTGTLTRDVYGTVAIVATGITLDGNGHKIIGDGNGIGIQAAGFGYITVREVKAQNHEFGISMTFASDSEINGCLLSGNHYGIYLYESKRNEIIGSDIAGNEIGIVLSALSDNNLVQKNIIKDCDYGLDLSGAFDNTIIQNTIQGSEVTGISIRSRQYTGTSVFNSNRNKIYNNDFIGNKTQARVYESGTDNIFNLGVPTGGNYWDNHTAADLNSDGFADTPYVFSGGQDNLPLMNRFGSSPTPVIDDHVEAINKILEEFDKAVAAGTIKGNGPQQKVSTFRGMLENVADKLEKDSLRAAYQKLNTVYRFIDGEKSPKDMVSGTARQAIAEMIYTLLMDIAL